MLDTKSCFLCRQTLARVKFSFRSMLLIFSFSFLGKPQDKHQGKHGFCKLWLFFCSGSIVHQIIHKAGAGRQRTFGLEKITKTVERHPIDILAQTDVYATL